MSIAKASMLLNHTKVCAPLATGTVFFYFRKSQTEKNDIETDNLRKESIDTQAELTPNLQ